MRIGILVNQGKIPLWQQEVLDHLAGQKVHQICCIIVRKNSSDSKKKKRTTSELFLKLLYRIEHLFVKPKNNPFKRVSINLPGIPVVVVSAIETAYRDSLSTEDIIQIQSFQPDLLIRFGFRILTGEILKVPSFGILSLHHGDTRSLRGSPPAFWEVFKRIPYTSVTAQILTEDLDAGLVIGRTTLRTDQYSYLRNKLKIYWAGVELLQYILSEQNLKHTGRSDCSEYVLDFYDKPLYRNPNSGTILYAFIQIALKNVYQQLRSVFFINQWNVFWYLQKNTQQSIPFYRFKPLPIPGDRCFADPFVIETDGEFTVFFEELIERERIAHISYLQIDKRGKLITPQPICCLKEPFHISYPFVFERNGNYYLMPETASEKKLVLYKSSGFPGSWHLCKVLMEEIRIYDATLIQHQGIDYIFCTTKSNDQLSSDVYMHIFYSKDILSEPLMAHPKNPVSRSVYGARSAGRIFKVGNELIRPAQIAAPVYGAGIVLMRIDELTESNYSESVMCELTLGVENQLPMHTLNQAGKMWVIDQQHQRFRWR